MNGKVMKKALCLLLAWTMVLGVLSGSGISYGEEPEEYVSDAAEAASGEEEPAEAVSDAGGTGGQLEWCREIFDRIDPAVKDFYWSFCEADLIRCLTEEEYEELLAYVKNGAACWNPSLYADSEAAEPYEVMTEEGIQLFAAEESSGSYQAVSGMRTLGNNVNLASLGRNGKDVWMLSLDGETAFCLDMTLRANSGRTYTRTGTTSDEVVRKAIAYYEQVNSSQDGYEFAQMYIWCGGSRDLFVRTMFEYALSRSDKTLYTPEKLLSMSTLDLSAALNALDPAYASALGKAYVAIHNQNTSALSDVYVFTGPSGYQRFTTLYQGVWKEAGETPDPGPDPEPEYPEPEYSTVTASASTLVSYEARIHKTDSQTGQGLSGVVFTVLREGSEIGEVSTDQDGRAAYEDCDTFTAQSGEKRYCTNFDEIDPDVQETIDCYHSEAEARAAAQAEADADVKRQAAQAKHTYVFVEKQARTGYYKDPAQAPVSLTVTAGGSAESEAANERVTGSIRLKKEDREAEDTVSHGQASLDGAIYDLYVGASDILHPDGKSGVAVYHGTVWEGGRWVEKEIPLTAGALAESARIQNGELIFDGLYLGEYVIRERAKETVQITSRDEYGKENSETRILSFAEGYLCDETEHRVVLTWNGQEYKEEIAVYPGAPLPSDAEYHVTVSDALISREQIIKSAFRLAKMGAGDGQTELQALEGVGFTVYQVDKLSRRDEFVKRADGSFELRSILDAYVNDRYTDQTLKYDFTGEQQAQAVLYAGEDEVFSYNELLRSGINGTGEGLIKTGTANQYRLSELYTNKEGILQSPQLPFGQYLVVETTPAGEYLRVEPFLVTVNETSPSLNHQQIRYLLDQKFEAYLKVIKKDADTGRTVCRPGAVFKLYDMENQRYIRQPALGSLERTELFTANSEGILVLAEPLPAGHYRIEEVSAPEGFYNEMAAERKGFVEFTVSTGQAYEASGEKTSTGKDILVITQIYENKETRGYLTIRKEGEALKDYEDGQLQYETVPLAGAMFEIRAAEDILTQDHQTDGEGDPLLWYEKGQLVATVVTGEDGQPEQILPSEENPVTQIVTGGQAGEVSVVLPLGRYAVTEIQAPYGYVRETEPVTVEFVWNGQTEQVVYNSFAESASEDGSVCFTDRRVKPEQEDGSAILGVGVMKKDSEDGNPLAGAVFGLYTKDAIYSSKGELLLEAGSLLAVSEPTDESGFAGFSVDIPIRDEKWSEGSACNSGRYRIREQVSPAGYLLNPQEAEVTFVYQGQEQEWIWTAGECMDTQTEIYISKQEIAGSAELPGCTLQILKRMETEEQETAEEPVMSWVSEETPVQIEGLELERPYLLRELRPADGYVTAEDILFCLKQAVEEETGELLMRSEVYVWQQEEETWCKTMDGQIVMKDDMTRGLISKTDLATGEPVIGAELLITDKEGNEIERWITEEAPHWIEKLKPGEYVLTEVRTPEGSDYSIAESIPFTVADSGEIWRVDMKDDHIRFTVGKVDAETGKNLKGAKLRLEYLPQAAADDGAGASALAESPVLICDFVSGETDTLFENMLPGTYRLTEMEAPEGYRIAEPLTFVVTNSGETQRFVMKDEKRPREPERVPETEPTPKAGQEQETGDRNGMLAAVLAVMACGAVLVLAGGISVRRKPQRRRHGKRVS